MTRTRDLTLAIVDALAAVEHRAPQELDYSLHDHVDTDALRALDSMNGTQWTLTFQVSNHEVTVADDGRDSVDGELVRVGETTPRHNLQ